MRPLCKGQGSVEFLAILGVALVVVVVITIAANDRLVALGKERTLTDAENSVNDLARAANNVYHRGSGASQNVFINIPSDTNLSKSYIANYTINLHLRGSDVSSRTEAQVSGKFPSSAGGAWVKVQSQGSYISVGDYYLDINRTSLYFTMQNGTSATFPLTIYNRGNKSITVTISTDVSKYSSAFLLSLSPSSNFTIAALSSTEMNFTFFTYPSAAGIYPAVATFSARNATSGTISEQLQLPLTIQVTLPPQYQNLSGLARLILSPSQWNVRTIPGNGSDQLFFVTTDGSFTAAVVNLTAFENSNFNISDLSTPIYNASSNYPPGPGMRTLSVNFSESGASGNYVGTLNATADGSYRATSTLNFTIDALGPATSNLSSNNSMPTNTSLVRLSLNTTEIFGGYVLVCQYKVNNGAYSDMAPTDGTFNEYEEQAYADTTLASDGLNNLTARCQDDLGNWGNTTNLSLYVDSTGPVVAIDNVSASSRNISVGAIASELLSGNLNVSWCNLTFYNNDTGVSNTTSMSAQDGAFNSAYEVANASMVLEYGLYTISVTCADSHSNARTASQEFYHNVNSCTTLNMDNTIYRLGNNVASGSTCFPVTADNVTLNCMGKSISGTNASGTYGVYTDQTGTTIKDCTISNFSSAIYYNSASGGTILNNSASTTFNGGYGIVLSATTSTSISNNTASSTNGSAIYLASSSNSNSLSGNSGTSPYSYGITLSASDSNTLTSNNATSTNGYGVYLSSSSSNNLSGTIGASSSSTAFYLSGGGSNTIDCQGRSTNSPGSGTYGVFSNQQYTTVKNCSISGFQYGIYLDSANGSIVQNNTVNASSMGIVVTTSQNWSGRTSNVLVQSNTLYNRLNCIYPGSNITIDSNTVSNPSGIGMYLDGCQNSVVKNNTVNSSQQGIYLAWSQAFRNVVANNTVYATSDGIRLYASTYSNNISGNNITSTGSYAISLLPSGSDITYSNNIRDNIATASAYPAIYLLSTANNTLSNNTARSNSSYGLFLNTSNNNSLTNNTISSNTSHGIYLLSSNSSTIANNTASSSGTSTGAITLSSSSNNSISGNNANSTSEAHGIYIYDSPNNTIFGNSFGAQGSSWSTSAVWIRGSQSQNNAISNNSIRNYGGGTGLAVYYGPTKITITNNTISTNSNNAVHVVGESGTQIPFNITLANNSISSPRYGIYLQSSNSTMAGNSITSSSSSYPSLYVSGFGNQLTGNNISSNSNTGVQLSSANYSMLTNNSINASASGIQLDSSSIGNKFYWNSLYRASAYINNSNATNKFSTAVAASENVSSTALAAYYPFTQNISSTSAGAVSDISGNGNNGTLGGGTAAYAPIWTNGSILNGAYVFDGIDDYIDLPDNGKLDFTNQDFTVFAWVSLAGYYSAATTCKSSPIVANDDWGWKLSLGTSGVLGFSYYYDASNSAGISAPNHPVQLNRFTHLAAVFSNTSSKLQLYMDGALANETTVANTSIYYAGADSPHIGAITGCGGQNIFFNGTIDHLAIYNRSLSASEISSIAKSQGNYYDNIASVAIYDSDGDGYGDTGSAYPYTSATSSKWVGSGADFGPMNANSTAPNACMLLDVAGQTYTVVANINATGAGACLNITAQNITLNCNGRTITGDNSSSSYGVYSNQFNTTVQNCNIFNFQHGIYFNGAMYGTIASNNASSTHSSGRGMLVAYSDYNAIENNRVSNTASISGLLLDSSDYNNLTGNSISTTAGAALALLSSSGNALANNSGSSSSSYGIYVLTSANNNRLTNSSGSSSSSYGIYISAANNITLNGGTFTTETGTFPFYIAGTTNSTFSNFIANDTSGGGYGIVTDGTSTYNTFQNCIGDGRKAGSGTDAGILIQANYNNVTNCTGISSGSYGIHINGVSNVIVTNSTATSGSNNGFYLTGSSNTLTNNIAYSASGTPIYATSCSNTYINNTATTPSSTYAMRTDYGTNTLINNTASAGGNLVYYLTSNTNSRFVGNIVGTPSSATALALYSGSGNVIANNTLNSTTGYGLYINTGSTGNTVINNTLIGARGIDISNSNSSNFTNNTILSSTSYGIYLLSSNTSNFIGNTINSTSSYGVYITGINNYFENNSNCLSCSNSSARFYSNAAQNTSSNTNIGWWPLLSSSGSDATALNMTAYYNGSSGGRFSNWTANSYLTYWYNGQVNTYDCQNITAPGIYLLKNNVSINGSTCFTFSASNITLDCQNNWITGNSTVSTFGVFSAQTSSTVQNCNIDSFDNGIRFNSTQLGLILNTFANTSNSYTYAEPYIHGSAFAFWSTTSRTNTIANSTGIGKSGNGLALRSFNVSVVNFTGTSTAGSTGQSGGIWIMSSSGNKINNSIGLCTGGSCAGISFRGTGSVNYIWNSVAIGNTGYAIRISQTSNIIIDNATMSSQSTGGGIELGDRSYRNVLKNSLINITSASSYGIYHSSSGTDTVPSKNTSFINVSIIGTNKGIYVLDERSAGAYFENVSNCLSCDNSTARFRSNATLNISSKGNIGWWPLLFSNGSDALALANTAFYNGSSGGKNSDWSANPMLSYWYGGQSDVGACMVLSAPGTYSLTSNVSATGANCFNITAQNVTLNCAGYSVTGNNSSSTYGVYSTQFNTTVKNCWIMDFNDQIRFNGAANGTIQNNTLIGSIGGYDLNLIGASQYTTVILNNFTGQGGSPWGINFDNTATNNTIANNSFTTTHAAAISTSGNRFINNTVNIASHGFYMFAGGNYIDCQGALMNAGRGGAATYGIRAVGTGSTIMNCNINSTSGIPIYLDASSNNAVTNISANSTSNSAIQISGQNNSIDCQGKNLIGGNASSTYGVYSNQTNTTVQNCNISNFQHGIYLSGSNSGAVQNTNASTTHGTGYAIYLSSSSGNTITNLYAFSTNASAANIVSSSTNNIFNGGTYRSDAQATYIGFTFGTGSNHNQVHNANITGYGARGGLLISSSHNITVTNSSLYSPSYYTLYIVTSSFNNTFLNNNFTGGSSATALYLNYMNNSLFANNTFNTSGTAFRIITGSNNQIIGNRMQSASGHGIYLDTDSNNNTFTNNNASTTAASGYGIYLSSSSGNQFTNTNATSSSGTATYLSSSSNNNFTNLNSISSSGAALALASSNSNRFVGSYLRTSTSSAYFSVLNLSASSYNLFANSTINQTSSGYGIFLRSNSDYNNFTNSIIRSGGGAIYPLGAYYNRFEFDNITSTGSTSYCVEGDSAGSSVFANSLFTCSGYGIMLAYQGSNVVANNTINAGTTGISIFGCCGGISLVNDIIQNNTINAGTGSAISISGSDTAYSRGHLISNNVLSSNTSKALSLSSTYNNNVSGNYFYSRDNISVYLSNVNTTNFTRNHINNSPTYGIYIYSGINNYFEYNNNSLSSIPPTVQKFWSGSAQNTASKGNLGWWPTLAGTGTEATTDAGTAWFNGTLGGMDYLGVPDPLNTYWYNGQS